MKRLLTLLLVALSVPPTLADHRDAPAPSGRTVRTWDLAGLSHAAAFHLLGRRARYRVSLDSLPAERGRWTVYDCDSADDALRTVWLAPDQEAADEMTVEGVLHLRYVEAGSGFDGFCEYRITNACRCR